MDSSAPQVSIVMPTYNCARYITQSIESVRRQTVTDWELIIVDDGSTDRTPERVRPFLEDPRIRYFQTPNRGQSKARNYGIRYCKAPLVAFLDADDLWTHDKLEKQLPLFENSPKVAVTYTQRWLIDEQGQVTNRAKRPMFRGDVVDVSISRAVPPLSASIVRTKVLRKVGGFNESLSFSEDYELWFRIAMDHHFDYIDEPLLLFRTGHASLTQRAAERRKLLLKTIIPHLLDECGGRERVSRQAIRYAYGSISKDLGDDLLPNSRLAAGYWYLRALRHCPTMLDMWKGLAKLFLPSNFGKTNQTSPTMQDIGV